jgi:hypothetical protein
MCSAKPSGGAPPPNPHVFQVFLYFSKRSGWQEEMGWDGEGEGKGGGEGEMMSERENSPGVVPI